MTDEAEYQGESIAASADLARSAPDGKVFLFPLTAEFNGSLTVNVFLNGQAFDCFEFSSDPKIHDEEDLERVVRDHYDSASAADLFNLAESNGQSSASVQLLP